MHLPHSWEGRRLLKLPRKDWSGGDGKPYDKKSNSRHLQFQGIVYTYFDYKAARFYSIFSHFCCLNTEKWIISKTALDLNLFWHMWAAKCQARLTHILIIIYDEELMKICWNVHFSFHFHLAGWKLTETVLICRPAITSLLIHWSYVGFLLQLSFP